MEFAAESKARSSARHLVALTSMCVRCRYLFCSRKSEEEVLSPPIPVKTPQPYSYLMRPCPPLLRGAVLAVPLGLPLLKHAPSPWPRH